MGLPSSCSNGIPTERKFRFIKGASKAGDLGTANEAVLALAQALKKDRLTIIALGPATNIATLLGLYPELVTRIKRNVWCAGRTPNMQFRPGNGMIKVCDCNFEKDPSAGEVLLASGVSLALSGYEPASYIRISKKDLIPLKNSGSLRDRWLYRQLIRWSGMWQLLLGSKDGFMPFDAITLSSFLKPGYMEHYPDIPVTIKEFGNDARSCSNKPRKRYLIASYQLESSRKADYFYKAKADLKEVILSLLIPSPPGYDCYRDHRTEQYGCSPRNRKSPLVRSTIKPMIVTTL